MNSITGRETFVRVYMDEDNVVHCLACAGYIRGYHRSQFHCNDERKLCMCCYEDSNDDRSGSLGSDSLIVLDTRPKAILYDNTKHIIIATLKKCDGIRFGCTYPCSACCVYKVILLANEQ